MRPTPLLRILLGFSAALYVLALATRSLIPALAATAVLFGIANARWRFAQGLHPLHPTAQRTIVPGLARVGDDVAVRLDVEDVLLPGSSLTLEDTVPAGVQALQSTTASAAHLAYTARLDAPGLHGWDTAQARWQDDTGFWHAQRDLHAVALVEAQPGPESLERGRRAASRRLAEMNRRDPAGVILEDLEIRTVRPFQASDRARDVDWKRVSKGFGLLAREWEREQRNRLWLLMDASWSMRTRIGSSSKLEHAAALSAEISQSAARAGLEVGWCIYDAERVLALHEPGRLDAGVMLLQTVAGLPAARQATRRPAVGGHDDGGSDFLATIARLAGRAPTSGFRSAFRTLGTSGHVAVVAFTDAHGAGTDFLDGMGALAQRGGRVLTAFLPDDAYHGPPPQDNVHDLMAAAREQRRLRHAETVLRHNGAGTRFLGPDDTGRFLLQAVPT